METALLVTLIMLTAATLANALALIVTIWFIQSVLVPRIRDIDSRAEATCTILSEASKALSQFPEMAKAQLVAASYAVNASDNLRKAVLEFRNGLLAANPKRGETFQGPGTEDVEHEKTLEQIQDFVKNFPGAVKDHA